MSRLFTILTLLFVSCCTYGQETDFINLIFKNTNDLEFTKTVGYENHSKFYLLSQTTAWSLDRFTLRHNNAKGLDTAAMLYLFTDSAINALISNTEKQNLINQAKVLSPRKLTNTYKTIKLVDTLHKPNNSYVYQLTDPIYTSDSTHAFIDAAIYYPNETDTSVQQAYEAQMLFIFKRSDNKQWKLVDKNATMFLW